jgi:hypothetical protein
MQHLARNEGENQVPHQGCHVTWSLLKGNAIHPNLTTRLKGSKLSEAMVRKPESKSFLGKAGFEKRDPAERLGFFVKKGRSWNL